MCSGNVRLSRRSPLEGMFPRAGSSLLLLMLSSLDFPICKIQNAPHACYGGMYEELKNFKLQNGKRSLQPRGRLAGMSESRRAVIHVRVPHICSRRCRQGRGDVNPNAEAKTKAGSTLILWLLLHRDADRVTLPWVTGSLTHGGGGLSQGGIFVVWIVITASAQRATPPSRSVNHRPRRVITAPQMHCRWCSDSEILEVLWMISLMTEKSPSFVSGFQTGEKWLGGGENREPYCFTNQQRAL